MRRPPNPSAGRHLRRWLVGIASAIAPVLVPHAALAAAQPVGPSYATYDGRVIDLRLGWQGARACTSDGVSTECFDTEAEMDAHLAGSGGVLPSPLVPAAIVSVGASGVVPLLSCGSAVRLYDGTSFGGSALNLTTRQVALNLSTWGFDNVTSSYSIGGCSATFYDGANVSGAVYPGSTSAFSSASSMVGGWDNRISSIYIS